MAVVCNLDQRRQPPSTRAGPWEQHASSRQASLRERAQLNIVGWHHSPCGTGVRQWQSSAGGAAVAMDPNRDWFWQGSRLVCGSPGLCSFFTLRILLLSKERCYFFRLRRRRWGESWEPGQALALLLVMPEVAPAKVGSWAGGKGEVVGKLRGSSTACNTGLEDRACGILQSVSVLFGLWAAGKKKKQNQKFQIATAPSREKHIAQGR